MFEVKRSEKQVNGQIVETWIAEFVSCNILEVEVGTTGYCGGDTGHGGRTYFRLKDIANTDFEASVDGWCLSKSAVIQNQLLLSKR